MSTNLSFKVSQFNFIIYDAKRVQIIMNRAAMYIGIQLNNTNVHIIEACERQHCLSL